MTAKLKPCLGIDDDPCGVMTEQARCPTHRAEHQRRRDAKRGSTTERGYGARHIAERKRWQRIVEAGQAECWRCHQPIDPDGPWDLGHDDNDRTKYRGPEHPTCNRRTSGRKTNAPTRWEL